MITSQQALLRATAKASFWGAFQDTPDIMAGLIHRVDSDSDQETYPGLAYAPRPREMEGSRTHRTVPGFSYSIVNKKWESTVDISYELWKYGRLGHVTDMLSSMGEKARMFPNRLVGDLINNGQAGTGHDGTAFYNTGLHTIGGQRLTTLTAQDNDLTTTGVANIAASTVLEMYTALQGHQAAYDGFLDGEGDPVIPGPEEEFVVLCPTGHMPAARAVYKNDLITGSISNDMKGTFRPILNPYADNTAEMFTFRTGGRRKPFLLQVAENVSLSDNMGGDSQFETKDVSFGTFGYYNVGYGDWRYSCRHIFAV